MIMTTIFQFHNCFYELGYIRLGPQTPQHLAIMHVFNKSKSFMALIMYDNFEEEKEGEEEDEEEEEEGEE